MKNFRSTLILSILLLAIAASSAFAQTSSFSYQGEFSNAGSPANGPFDMEFRLFDAAAGGTQIGATVTRNAVTVTDGIFGVILDFGLTAFPGADRFVEISVRPQGGQFSTLSPRSQMLSSPYAIRAKTITGPINGTSASATLTVTNDQPGITNPSPQNLPPAALRGEATSTVDANIGLLGIASGSSGTGVIGIGNGGGAGVLGLSTSTTGDTEGLSGEVLSPDGTALDLHMPTGGTGHLISASSAKITRFTVNSDGNVTASGSVTANGVNSTSGVTTVQLNAQAISVQSLGVSGPVQMNSGAGIIGNLGVNGAVNANEITSTGAVNIGGTLGVSGTVNIGNIPGSGNAPLCTLSTSPNVIRFCSSSMRYKDHARPFTAGLSLIDKLRPIVFTWKENGASDIGLAAEDVAAVEPMLTFSNEKGEVEGVKYAQLNVFFVNAIKEQQAQIERQQAQIDKLTKLVRQMTAGKRSKRRTGAGRR